MKLIRWMEQHIRGSRKKDKEEKEKGKQNKKNRKLQRSYDEVGSVAKLQGNELQNAVREQTTSTVESLLGPLYSAGEPTIAKTENNPKGTYDHNVALELGTDLYAFDEDQRTEGGVYAEIPDTPPPPAPPSIANRIPLQHIRCIGQTSTVGDVAIQAQQCNSETPKERTRIKTNPWFVSSPQSPCCSSSTSGDSGAWTATSSDRSGRTMHTQEGQTPVESANHDWYYADSSSSTTSLSKKVPPVKASQLYQNVLPLEEPLLNSRMAGGKRVLYRYPSGTHLSSAGHPTPWQFHRRPESARTYRKSYFINHCGDDTADFTSSEDEAFSDDYQLGSVTSQSRPIRRRSGNDNGEFGSPQISAIRASDLVERLCNRGTSRQCGSGCRGGQLQFPYASGIPEKQGQGYCSGGSPALKTPCPKNDYGRPLKPVERQMRQQDNFLLHRELLQFKQFLLMRTLENMGSELNMSRNALFGSPQLRSRDLLERHDLYGLSPRLGQRQPLPPGGHVAPMSENRLPPRQASRAVPHHQSPRLVPKLTRSPLKDARGRNPQMSPRTPRPGHSMAYPQDTASQITQLTQMPHHEMKFDRFEHPRNAPLSNAPKLPCSPKVGMRVNPAASPLIGRPLYAKPKGVPRTTTIDFQAFASPSRKQTGELA